MDELNSQPTPEGKSNPPEDTANPSTNPLKQIRTFQGDVAGALANQKESLFSIQQSERLKQSFGGTVHEPVEKSKHMEVAWLTLGSLVLLTLGSAGAWFGYQEFVRKTAPPVVSTPESRLISVQDEKELNFASTTRDAFFNLIHTESTGVAENNLKHFVLRRGVGTSAPLTNPSEFFAKVSPKAPSNLVRAFEPLFMLGALGEKRFLILKLSSFENAFAGMLSWESGMPREIGDLFSTSPYLKTIGPETVFKDVISRNKDVRVLSSAVSTAQGTSTEPVLVYSFFENRILIITENLETLRILMERLTQELLSR